MRSFKIRLVTLASVTLCFIACSSTEEGQSNASAGAGGSTHTVDDQTSGAAVAGTAGTGAAGAAVVPDPVSCGAGTCEAIAVGNGFVAPCCVDPATGSCGADVSALTPSMGCQPLSQPGTLDADCPSSAGAMLNGFPLPEFPGCCREATGECGFAVDDLGGALPFEPGCVPAASVIPGTVPSACGAGGQGTAGGAGNAAAGAPGDEGGAGEASGGAGGAH